MIRYAAFSLTGMLFVARMLFVVRALLTLLLQPAMLIASRGVTLNKFAQWPIAYCGGGHAPFCWRPGLAPLLGFIAKINLFSGGTQK